MKKKLLNISFYLGGVPLYWLYNVIHHRGKCREYHYLQAIALNLLFFYSLIVFVICFAIHNLFFYFDLSLVLKIPMELSFYILGVLLFACFFLWVEGIIAAIIGYVPKIPLYALVISKPSRVKGSIFLMTIRHIIVVSVILMMIHSSTITHSEVEEAEIYMLYDDMGYIPRVVFTSGFYLESLAARSRWGEDSVAILPLTKENIDFALNNGRLVYFASHGANGCIQLQTGELFWPHDLEGTLLSPTLQYVYFTGCETGLLHNEWENALIPAHVKTFDRLSATMEHVYWLIVDGTEVINSLK